MMTLSPLSISDRLTSAARHSTEYWSGLGGSIRRKGAASKFAESAATRRNPYFDERVTQFSPVPQFSPVQIFFCHGI
jgi:hypothetical protein